MDFAVIKAIRRRRSEEHISSKGFRPKNNSFFEGSYGIDNTEIRRKH